MTAIARRYIFGFYLLVSLFAIATTFHLDVNYKEGVKILILAPLKQVKASIVQMEIVTRRFYHLSKPEHQDFSKSLNESIFNPCTARRTIGARLRLDIAKW